MTSVSLWLQCSFGANDNVICACRCAGALLSRLNWMTSCLMYQSKCVLHYNLINLFWWAFLTWLFQSTRVLHWSSQAGAKAHLGVWANFSTGTRTNYVGGTAVYLLNFFFLVVVQKKMWQPIIPYRICLLFWSLAWFFWPFFSPLLSKL